MSDLQPGAHGEAGLTRGAVDLQRYTHSLMGTYGVPMRVLARGEGSWVWDADGNRYLDLLGGIAVNALGHAHPAWVAAIAHQAGTLAQASNFFATEPQIRLAERLLDLAQAPPGSRVFFANSGTEANEAAFKMARRTGKGTVIALEHGFHGRSMGALSMTAKEAIRAPFAPLLERVVFVEPTDEAALRAAVAEAGDDLAAIILEPIQGEAGVRPVPHAFIAAARELTLRHHALLIMDEIQTGVARTGAWFAHQLGGIRPDVMTLAKGLGGGFPIGAVVAFGETAGALLTKGDHGTTFGGNALAAAAALATLDVIESEDLLANAKAVGEHLRTSLEAIEGVVEVRGEGLMLGIGLAHPAAATIAAAAVEAGFIVNPPSPDTIRLVPALTLTRPEADLFIAWMAEHGARLITEGSA
ncbi:acetylornithine transaminase [Demequina lignilytica]|uniref:Acetylornithine aminotransferase n=1 Tax=Demequina lignilytica TaxID=3051663 RepID=A0AB35MJI2_9MICO|nr:acetylornithine transaminase [Demequina sp. SYSU T0a273]MDN4483870.1 acetylornithine transaminase [Demequina sp. SYSU T0a273]